MCEKENIKEALDLVQERSFQASHAERWNAQGMMGYRDGFIAAFETLHPEMKREIRAREEKGRKTWVVDEPRRR
jgi:hypothetical protein